MDDAEQNEYAEPVRIFERLDSTVYEIVYLHEPATGVGHLRVLLDGNSISELEDRYPRGGEWEAADLQEAYAQDVRPQLQRLHKRVATALADQTARDLHERFHPRPEPAIDSAELDGDTITASFVVDGREVSLTAQRSADGQRVQISSDSPELHDHDSRGVLSWIQEPGDLATWLDGEFEQRDRVWPERDRYVS